MYDVYICRWMHGRADRADGPPCREMYATSEAPYRQAYTGWAYIASITACRSDRRMRMCIALHKMYIHTYIEYIPRMFPDPALRLQKKQKTFQKV